MTPDFDQLAEAIGHATSRRSMLKLVLASVATAAFEGLFPGKAEAAPCPPEAGQCANGKCCAFSNTHCCPYPVISGQSVSLQLTPAIASSPKFSTAQAACQKYLPPGSASEQITTKDQDAYLKAAACMRSHGIEGFPDPVFSGGAVGFPLPKGMDPNSTQFLRAREICEMLIPSGLPFSKQAEGGR